MTHSNEVPGSITEKIQLIQNESEQREDAENELFRRYYRVIVDKARRRVQRLAMADESDVAISVLDTVFRGIADGKHECTDRTQFEELLSKVTFHKAVNLYNWVKRARRHPNKKELDNRSAQFDELDDQHRHIAELFYMEGYSVEQIASLLGASRQDIAAKLSSIRQTLGIKSKPVAFANSEAVESLSVDNRPFDSILFEELIESFDRSLRETVLLKLAGHENRDIAEQLDISERQVQRRLKLLRETLLDGMGPE